MALAFQYGFSLVPDTDYYDNENYEEKDVAQSKVIKYAAVNESDAESRLIVKIATEINQELGRVSPLVFESFKAYMEEIKYAGTRLTVVNYEPDIIQLSMSIYRDPLVIDVNGVNVRTGRKPVEEGIKQFLKELPFF